MKDISLTALGTAILSLIIIYILHPLNKGGIGIVVFLSAGIITVVQLLFKRIKKNEK